MPNSTKAYDVFISHASEDKGSFVRPLAESLRNLGLELWYDEFTLQIGDSLSESIDRGLARSRYGLVVISPHFIAKKWTKRELRGLVARDVEESGVILPIWLGVTKEQVLKFSPPLADTVALNTEDIEAEDMALQLLRVIRPDIYEQHPRAELARLASGDALEELKSMIESTREELEKTRTELAKHTCPTCGAGVARAAKDEIFFQCGFRRIGGEEHCMCPQHPDFPDLYEFTICFVEYVDGWDVESVDGKSPSTRLASRTFPVPPPTPHETAQAALETWVARIWNKTVRDDLRRESVDLSKVVDWETKAFDYERIGYVPRPSTEARFRQELSNRDKTD